MSITLSTLWTVGVVLTGAVTGAHMVAVRRRSDRLRRHLDAAHSATPLFGDRQAGSPFRYSSLVAAIGRGVIRVLPFNLSADPAAVGQVALASALAVSVNPVVGLAVVVIPAMSRRRSRRRRDRHRVALIRAELGLLLDLLRVAVSAGMTLRQAIVVVCSPTLVDEVPGELSAILLRAVQAVSHGERFVDSITAMVELPVIGHELRLLASTFISAERFGTPPGPALATLAGDVRDLRRRLAEADARRVPVRMLAPLVLLLLPSFALLTLAPLLAGGLGSLRLTH